MSERGLLSEVSLDQKTDARKGRSARADERKELQDMVSNGVTRQALRRLPVAVGAIVMFAALAACSGGGAPQSGEGNSGSEESADGGGKRAAGGKVDIYVVGGLGDPFFSTVKRGVDDAAQVVKAVGGNVHYLALPNYENLGPDAAKLTQTAISNNASIILVPDWVPESQNPAIKQAVKAGIPVIIYNSGADQVQKVGAIGYIGSEDRAGGVAAGKYLAEQDVKHVLCVNTVPGAANLEARCDGVSEGERSGGGKSTELPLPSSNFGNPTAVAQAIKSAVLKDDTIDGVITMGGQDASSAAGALDQASLTGKVALATFDVNESVLKLINDDKMMVAVDQQGYLQGFNAVSMAYQYVLYGLKLPQSPLLTGPVLVTADNVDAALAGAAAGVR